MRDSNKGVVIPNVKPLYMIEKECAWLTALRCQPVVAKTLTGSHSVGRIQYFLAR